MSDQKLPAKAVTSVMRLNSLLGEQAIRSRFEDMLGKRASAFMSSILSATTTNKALAECEPMSIISAAAIAASFDLPINQNLGFAYIVPYKDKGFPVAQFQLGWRGYVQLALRTGQYKTINAAIVHEGQLVEGNEFTGEMMFRSERTSDKVTGYVFYFKLLNGFEKWVYMTREGCEAHGKKYSKAYAKGFGMWKDDFDTMALKTVVRLGLSKWGILSIEMQNALEHDYGVIDGEVVNYPDAIEKGDAEKLEPPKPKKSRLSQVVESTALNPAEEPGVDMNLTEDEKFNFEKKWQETKAPQPAPEVTT